MTNQDPAPSSLAAKGSPISVKFGPATQQTVTVPPNLVGNTLSGAEQILNNAGIPYNKQPAGSDPTKGQNIVSKVDPDSGTSIPKGQYVTLYVVNYSTGTPTVTPNPSPTVKPTATPTTAPTATPTRDADGHTYRDADPTPTATPDPTPTENGIIQHGGGCN